MNLHELFLTENACYKTGKTQTVKKIMWHSTGANNPFLSRYVGPDDGILGVNKYNNHWNQYKPDGRSVCVHAFIGYTKDKKDIATYQTLPWDHVGWHSGKGNKGSANTLGYVSFEVCEDGLDNKEYFDRVYNEAIELSVMLCKKYNLTEKDIIDHAEGYKLGIASNHGDITHWLRRFGLSMNDVRREVAKRLNDKAEDTKPNTLYRVQVGAYSVKENAEKLLQDLSNAGFKGFITETSVITPPMPPKEETNIKSKYYKIGDAQIIETDPDNIEISILGDTLDKSVGVNGVLFDTKTAPVTDPESCVFIAMNDGKPLSNNAQFNGYNGPPRATLIYHTNKKLGFRQLKDITTIKDNTIWAVGGFMVKPYMDFKSEQIPPGVNYKTAHTYIGYDAEGKIYIIVKPNHMIADIVPLLNQLKITNAIVLDGGGSSQLNHLDGQYKSTRKINSAILLKEI